MLRKLRYPIYLKMKKRVPDEEGGWEDQESDPLLVWAALEPLSSSKSETSKPLEALSVQGFPGGERFQVMIRVRPDLLEIAEGRWDRRKLLPLTQPVPMEKNPGFVSFQVLLLPTPQGEV